ncbi:hypothetical protein BJ508DRAFT_336620 [Ascobolus immersus RN42]|uniref:Uncharacterized protein n=1 Tax=Ascobolus immersus RN42 TaxID=1160509 RepID=A0A3N4HER5_ASCIM|nr:hypothetical protein BJ508DRAFT_336620 [Ascobolus immersus RN42]
MMHGGPWSARRLLNVEQTELPRLQGRLSTHHNFGPGLQTLFSPTSVPSKLRSLRRASPPLFFVVNDFGPGLQTSFSPTSVPSKLRSLQRASPPPPPPCITLQRYWSTEATRIGVLSSKLPFNVERCSSTRIGVLSSKLPFNVERCSSVPTPSWFEMAQALEDVKPVEVSYEGESSDESEIEPTATSTRPSTPAGDN